jgi:hypothetical protein
MVDFPKSGIPETGPEAWDGCAELNPRFARRASR